MTTESNDEHRRHKHRHDPVRSEPDERGDRSARHAGKKPRLSKRDEDSNRSSGHGRDWRRWIEDEDENDNDETRDDDRR